MNPPGQFALLTANPFGCLSLTVSTRTISAIARLMGAIPWRQRDRYAWVRPTRLATSRSVFPASSQ